MEDTHHFSPYLHSVYVCMYDLPLGREVMVRLPQLLFLLMMMMIHEDDADDEMMMRYACYTKLMRMRAMTVDDYDGMHLL